MKIWAIQCALLPALASVLLMSAGCGGQGADAASQAQLEQEVQQLREANQELQQLRAENQELSRLKRDNEELNRLKAQIEELAQLRKENEELRGQLEALRPTKPRR